MPTDVLSQMLEVLRLHGSVYCRSVLGAPWRLRFLPHQSMVFHALESGTARLEVGGQSLVLQAGDFVLLPRGSAHEVCHPSQTEGARVPSIAMSGNTCTNEVWSSTPDAVLLCGTFVLDSHQQHLLQPVLPEVLHIPAQPWLDALLHPMALEAAAPRQGSQTVLRRLSDTLFVQVIRHALLHQPLSGWLAGLQDRQLLRALEAIHNDPSQAWTTARLAACAGISRSGFADKFRRVVGQTPHQYLTDWRMTLATGWLQQPRASLPDIAQRLGYQSEVAFHRAFKRTTGQTPGVVKRRALD